MKTNAMIFTKINLRFSKKSFVLSGTLAAMIFLELMLYVFILPSEVNGYLSLSNMLLFNLLIIPLITTGVNFRKAINLGMKKRNYKLGALLCYVVVAGGLSFICLAIYYFEKIVMSHTQLWYINILDTFKWFRFGIIGCFIYQFLAYMVIMMFIHTITIGTNGKLKVISYILVALCFIGAVSFPGSRNILLVTMKNLLFNDNLLLQAIISSFTVSVLYFISSIILKRKIIL